MQGEKRGTEKALPRQRPRREGPSCPHGGWGHPPGGPCLFSGLGLLGLRQLHFFSRRRGEGLAEPRQAPWRAVAQVLHESLPVPALGQARCALRGEAVESRGRQDRVLVAAVSGQPARRAARFPALGAGVGRGVQGVGSGGQQPPQKECGRRRPAARLQATRAGWNGSTLSKRTCVPGAGAGGLLTGAGSRWAHRCRETSPAPEAAGGRNGTPTSNRKQCRAGAVWLAGRPR